MLVMISNKKAPEFSEALCVRAEGLEPPCREALDPKSSMSTNFTTPAFNRLRERKNRIFCELPKPHLPNYLFLLFNTR
jgi:hypothetical protein